MVSVRAGVLMRLRMNFREDGIPGQQTGQLHRGTMMFRFVIAAMALLASIGSASAAEIIAAEAVRPTLAGKTIQISTPMGTVPVNFRADGSMTGGSHGLASYAMATTDRGRWWVSGNKLCQQWQNWFDKATHCFELRREGQTLYWSGGGRSGVATISD